MWQGDCTYNSDRILAPTEACTNSKRDDYIRANPARLFDNSMMRSIIVITIGHTIELDTT